MKNYDIIVDIPTVVAVLGSGKRLSVTDVSATVGAANADVKFFLVGIDHKRVKNYFHENKLDTQ